ncbi:MAG TPA: Tol-Pal system protein TolB [Gammaproteobacteria bacterium]|nr:Tol-Pal system protein TolB [Gammaproteobacteria bacterium]
MNLIRVHNRLVILISLWVLCLMLSMQANAVLTIKITGGTVGATPIAIVPYEWQGMDAMPLLQPWKVVSANLLRSGRFKPLPEEDMLAKPGAESSINFADWRLIGAEYLVASTMRELGHQKYEIEFVVYDVFRARPLKKYTFPTTAKNLRATAHAISDAIYQLLTGQPGDFSTRIAYVEVEKLNGGLRYRLQVADADGFNPQTVLESPEPILSPAWSADGRNLAYVSLENRYAEIFIQELATGQARRLARYKGLNGAPSWSPDGRQLALTLSKDGNAEIYVMDLSNQSLRRLTKHYAIDTEPTWTPDGKHIAFLSERGGKPQIYMISAKGGSVRRMTFEGDYNSEPTFSRDGKKMAFVHGSQGKFRIAVMDIETGVMQILTDSNLDESPSFSPNGNMILYATNLQQQGILAAVSTDGRVKQQLATQQGDVREPAWSPYRK